LKNMKNKKDKEKAEEEEKKKKTYLFLNYFLTQNINNMLALERNVFKIWHL
jgi:hypothetical protein